MVFKLVEGAQKAGAVSTATTSWNCMTEILVRNF
jgi:hypothetical protein